MWLTSNNPTALRTARCSSTMPAYCTGISQPPKSTMRAPMDTCTACNGVRFNATDCSMGNTNLTGGARECQTATGLGAIIEASRSAPPPGPSDLRSHLSKEIERTEKSLHDPARSLPKDLHRAREQCSVQ